MHLLLRLTKATLNLFSSPFRAAFNEQPFVYTMQQVINAAIFKGGSPAAMLFGHVLGGVYRATSHSWPHDKIVERAGVERVGA